MEAVRRCCLCLTVAAGVAGGVWMGVGEMSEWAEGVKAQPVRERSREELEFAMRYHGTYWAVKEGGEWWFERGGERCKLFNENVERRLRWQQGVSN